MSVKAYELGCDCGAERLTWSNALRDVKLLVPQTIRQKWPNLGAACF